MHAFHKSTSSLRGSSRQTRTLLGQSDAALLDDVVVVEEEGHPFFHFRQKPVDVAMTEDPRLANGLKATGGAV